MSTFTERLPRPPALGLESINLISDCVVSGVGDDLETGGGGLPRYNVMTLMWQLSVPAAAPCCLPLGTLLLRQAVHNGFLIPHRQSSLHG